MAGIARKVVGAGALALALGGAGAARAQDLRMPDAGFIGFGVSGVGTEELDEQLAEQGYPTFGSRARTPSLGVYWRLSSGWMLGGEWHGLVFDEKAHEGREVGLGGGYGTLGVGYAVDLSSRTRVYPRVGLGGGGMGLWFESEQGSVGFDEVLDDPDGQANPDQVPVLTRGGVVVDFGAGFELLPGRRGRGPLVGLRVGYLASPFDDDWQLDGEAVEGIPATGGPSASIGGPYFRVVVGAGRRR